jgi:hypothetical protein
MNVEARQLAQAHLPLNARAHADSARNRGTVTFDDNESAHCCMVAEVCLQKKNVKDSRALGSHLSQHTLQLPALLVNLSQ